MVDIAYVGPELKSAGHPIVETLGDVDNSNYVEQDTLVKLNIDRSEGYNHKNWSSYLGTTDETFASFEGKRW